MAWLKQRLLEDRVLVLPGVYDCLSAKLAAAAGCEAIYCSGFVVSASGFGLPDLGLLSNAELRSVYKRIADASHLPLIVDGDTGDGGLLNVERSVAALGAAGIAAVHIEDQVTPKRCGHIEGTEVVSRKDAAARIKAAVLAGNTHGVEIIGRTDALQSLGADEAIARANMFLTLGAAAAFIDGLREPQIIRKAARAVQGPLLFNSAPFRQMPAIPNGELQEMGYRIVLYPGDLVCAASSAVQERLSRFTSNDFASQRDTVGPEEINALTEQDIFMAREHKFSEYQD